MLVAMPHLKSVGNCRRRTCTCTIHLERLYGSWHEDTNWAREREVPTPKKRGKINTADQPMDRQVGW
jgi:hypothetical protein